MLTRPSLTQPGDSFQGLLLRLRGRTGLTQRELAARLGMHPRSIQGWEAGSNYPTDVSLRAVLAVYLAANAFPEANESSEAAAVWSAALRQAPRMRTAFDPVWFAALLRQRAAATEGAASVEPSLAVASNARMPARRQDWGEAPSIATFQGRVNELQELERIVVAERCRVVALLGMGGIGKTSIAARLANDLASDFERVYWRSLRDALPTIEWLAGAIAFLSDQMLVLPKGEPARLKLLLDLLRERRSLLVLDNFETVLQPGARLGAYRHDYAGYGALLHRLGESGHQSCLLITSREAPPELGPLVGEHGPVRSTEVAGLAMDEGRALLQDKALRGDEADWVRLVERYGGNGLALRIAGESIRRVFGGDIGGFLGGNEPVFGGIQRLLDEQFVRLSDLELQTLRWLAVEREPVDLDAVKADLVPGVSGAAVVETLESLRGRSLLVEGRIQPGTFTLGSNVLEYVTDRLVEDATHEITTHAPRLLLSHALVKATAKEHVRQSQERLIAGPLLEGLIAASGGRAEAERSIIEQLSSLRTRSHAQQGYGPGNLVNLLRLLRGNLRGVDLSGLAIRQAYLQDVEAQDASAAGASLTQSVLAEAFAYPSSIALSADGAYLAAGSVKGEVRVWRVLERAAVMAATGHAGAVMGLALSGDGRLLASGGLDGMVKVWETATGELRASITGHRGGVWGLALSHSGELLASGGGDGRVTLWQTAKGECLASLEGHVGQVWGVALSGDGRLVAGSGVDVIRVWDASTGHLLTALDGQNGVVMGVALSQDGHVLASGGHNGMARVWCPEEGKPLANFGGHHGPVYRVALSADGRLLASAGHDGMVKLWDTQHAELRATLQGHTGQVYAVALSGDGQLVASGSQDGTVKMWEASTGRLVANLQGWGGGIRGVALSADGQMLASSGADAAVGLWDATSGRLRARLPGYSSLVPAVALSDDGQLMASGESDGTIKLWETGPPRLISTLTGHDSLVSAVALTGDGRLVVSGGVDERVKIWEAATGVLLADAAGHSGGVRAVALSADGRLAASGGGDRTVKLWALPAGQLLATLEGHTGQVFGTSLSADGQIVASSGLDGMIKLWEAPTGRLITTLERHTGGVWAVALSRDGRVVVTGGQDGTVGLWETRSGELLGSLSGHTDGIWAVAVSADGQLIASGSIDGTIRLWDITSGIALRTLRGDRRYERLNVTGLKGVTQAQWDGLVALGAQSLDTGQSACAAEDRAQSRGS